MQSHAILLENISPNDLREMIAEIVHLQLQDFYKNNPEQKDELLSRKEACEFLKIDSSTLWHWTNKGKSFATR